MSNIEGHLFTSSQKEDFRSYEENILTIILEIKVTLYTFTPRIDLNTVIKCFILVLILIRFFHSLYI